VATPTNIDGSSVDRIGKSRTLIIVVVTLFSILVARLFFIQIISGEKNNTLSVNNRVTLETVKAERGMILDRHGKVLARSRPSYSVTVTPYLVPKKTPLLERLLKIRDISGTALFDSTKLSKKLDRARWRRYKSNVLKENISIEFVSVLGEHAMELPGIMVQTEARREYPRGEEAFHLLGYLGEISKDDIDSLREYGYQSGDNIGKSGIEYQYEDILHGADGNRYYEVNARGRKLGVVEDMPFVNPEPGQNIYLSIDAELQRIVSDSFPAQVSGALVALNPQNGEVLAMYSNPTVDPNIFSLSADQRKPYWQEIAFDPGHPLQNRAIRGKYPPGSTFKPITAIAAIDSFQISPKKYMGRACTGGIRLGNSISRCWNSAGHGYLSLYDALKVSCNVYFYQVGMRIGDTTINHFSREFGLGAKTGVDIPGERKGWLTGSENYNYKYRNIGWKWTEGLVLHQSIGQGFTTTPMQLAQMIGGIGNGKELYQPSILKEIRLSDGTVISQNEHLNKKQINVSEEAIAAVKEGMRRVVWEPGGTGRRVRVKGVEVGGKSGSAENPHGDKTHALFVAFAPIDNPVIAVAAVLENAGHGGAVAAPVVGAMLRYYFSSTKEGQAIVEQEKIKRDAE
jgi:penicillin-binding protein 2